MGKLTVVMGVLTLLGIVSGATLVFFGETRAFALGAALFLASLALLWLAHMSYRSLGAQSRSAAMGEPGVARATIASVTPVAAIFVSQLACFLILVPSDGARALDIGWSYLVATGPAMVLAAGRDRTDRTILGIRAYAAHLSYAVLLFSMLVLRLPLLLPGLVMLAPLGLLPFTIGFHILRADRETLQIVRI